MKAPKPISTQCLDLESKSRILLKCKHASNSLTMVNAVTPLNNYHVIGKIVALYYLSQVNSSAHSCPGCREEAEQKDS